MKKIDKIIRCKCMPYILMILLTAVICIPIFTMNLFLRNEATLHMARIISIDEVLKDGVFPPIIDYKFMNGFGYALNLFYGPLTTYIPIVIYNIFGTAGLSFKVFSILTVIVSFIAMYKCTYSITKRRSISTISALLYISMPYKLSNIYSRNAIGEFTALIFVPIVFEGLYNILNGDKKKSYLLSIGIIGLVLSHTISTIYMALFCLIYLLLNIDKLKNIKVWKIFGINIVISFLVCAFYAIPLLEHMLSADYTIFSPQKMGSTPEAVQNTGLSLGDLFANEAGDQEIRFSLGFVTIILSILTFFCYKKIKKDYKDTYISFIILSIITLVMSTKLFPWLLMPNFLTVIQFAWRNLGFFAFFASFVLGVNAIVFAEDILKKEVFKDTFIFAVIISIFVFSFLGVLRDWKFDDLSGESLLDKRIKENEKVPVFQVNREYMPLKANNDLDYVQNRENKTYVISGKAEIIEENKEKLSDDIFIENVESKAVLELPYLYYLGYDAEIKYDDSNFEKLELTESDKGFIEVEIKQCPKAQIKVRYNGTILEKISYIISAFGLIILIIYIIKERRNNGQNKKEKQTN